MTGVCPVCDVSLGTGLLPHVVEVHTGTPLVRWACSLCPYRTSVLESLLLHSHRSGHSVEKTTPSLDLEAANAVTALLATLQTPEFPRKAWSLVDNDVPVSRYSEQWDVPTSPTTTYLSPSLVSSAIQPQFEEPMSVRIEEQSLENEAKPEIQRTPARKRNKKSIKGQRRNARESETPVSVDWSQEEEYLNMDSTEIPALPDKSSSQKACRQFKSKGGNVGRPKLHPCWVENGGYMERPAARDTIHCRVQMTDSKFANQQVECSWTTKAASWIYMDRHIRSHATWDPLFAADHKLQAYVKASDEFNVRTYGARKKKRKSESRSGKMCELNAMGRILSKS